MLGMDRSVEQIRSAGGTRQLFRKHVMLLCDRQPPVAHLSQLITAYAHIISTSIGMANSMLCVIHFTHLRSHFILFVYFIAVVVVSRTYTTRTSQCTCLTAVTYAPCSLLSQCVQRQHAHPQKQQQQRKEHYINNKKHA